MSDEASTVHKVKRMSSVYAAVQDRFRLAAQMDDGTVQALWLTQRMLRLALTPLGDYFAQSQKPSAEQKARRSYSELMHKVSGKAGPPISTLPVANEWLVEVVDLKFGPPLCFVFRGENDRYVTMEMDPLHLRKWLGIIHRKSIKAGWPPSLWPDAVVAELE
ncbi:hypothetical protein [Caenimonas koreensis]|uniref:Uncharacterized protein n=1 Tax=Caenimonas koreensis DSM 17982 TaxID=1121255 RepID=A0A844ASE1_9BURK|nr:hypothetical protein [Caenimonas koreensis]MRD47235.1 hypothetical protein [Caenimonas koreensis DSM 17982]